MEIKYKSYTDAQKKAIYTYRSKNKEKINNLAKKYYDQKKDDPEYIQKKREACKRAYEKRKLLKNNTIEIDDEFECGFMS